MLPELLRAENMGVNKNKKSAMGTQCPCGLRIYKIEVGFFTLCALRSALCALRSAART